MLGLYPSLFVTSFAQVKQGYILSEINNNGGGSQEVELKTYCLATANKTYRHKTLLKLEQLQLLFSKVKLVKH